MRSRDKGDKKATEFTVTRDEWGHCKGKLKLKLTHNKYKSVSGTVVIRDTPDTRYRNYSAIRILI